MALPNKEAYIPVKTIYILKAPPRLDGRQWSQHGVGFTADGRGSTTSFADAQFLIKTFGYRDITRKYWAAKKKAWDKLVKAESLKGKKKPAKEAEDEIDLDELSEEEVDRGEGQDDQGEDTEEEKKPEDESKEKKGK